MGIGGISVWSLLLILVIVLLLFGTKKLRNVGGDLGGAIKGFKDAVKDGESSKDKDKDESQAQLEENEAHEGEAKPTDETREKHRSS